MSRCLAILTSLPLLAIASTAAAQPVAVEKQSAPVPAPAVRVDLGAGSAVGSIGVVYSRPFDPQLAVEIGAGYGFSGVQLSLMGKYQRGSGSWRFTPGLGLSLGIPVGEPTFHSGHPAGDDERRGRGKIMPWLDVDLVGVEYRSAGGFVFAASGGLNVALASAHWDVIDMGDDISPGAIAPQFRLGFGKTF